MKLHQKYSQTNCFLECRLFYAQNQIMQIYNRSTACTPWYLPFIDGAHYLCDPWELQEINRFKTLIYIAIDLIGAILFTDLRD